MKVDIGRPQRIPYTLKNFGQDYLAASSQHREEGRGGLGERGLVSPKFKNILGAAVRLIDATLRARLC
jgi:hypothetical protein